MHIYHGRRYVHAEAVGGGAVPEEPHGAGVAVADGVAVRPKEDPVEAPDGLHAIEPQAFRAAHVGARQRLEPRRRDGDRRVVGRHPVAVGDVQRPEARRIHVTSKI